MTTPVDKICPCGEKFFLANQISRFSRLDNELRDWNDGSPVSFIFLALLTCLEPMTLSNHKDSFLNGQNIPQLPVIFGPEC
jgi:hypothetical protein